MKPYALVEHAAEVLAAVRSNTGPVDRALAGFYRGRRYLGPNDRRFIGDTVYHTLRHLMRIDEALSGTMERLPLPEALDMDAGFPSGDPRSASAWALGRRAGNRTTDGAKLVDRWRVVLAATERDAAWAEQLEEGFVETWPQEIIPQPEPAIRRMFGHAREVLAHLAKDARPIRIAQRHSIPEWLFTRMGHGLTVAELPQLAAALNESASPVMRVNTLRATREEVVAILKEAGHANQRGTIVPNAIILERRLSSELTEGVLAGKVEFQDEGSQFLVEVLHPAPGSMVVDACAGGGGKTLHAAALMNNTGLLLAFDVVESRLKNLRARADAAGVTIIDSEAIKPDAPAPDKCQNADLVVLDVPCSGLGTLRRSPELKWRLARGLLMERVALQARLLATWAPCVRVGGRLAYLTCSLLAEENSAQIERFLAANKNFRRASLADNPLVQPTMLTPEGDLHLLPHRHGTDGFFLSLLERTE